MGQLPPRSCKGHSVGWPVVHESGCWFGYFGLQNALVVAGNAFISMTTTCEVCKIMTDFIGVQSNVLQQAKPPVSLHDGTCWQVPAWTVRAHVRLGLSHLNELLVNMRA